jgi:tRNA-Thr(GGU) m(6)t(6)A37 methyltransferase TsaA
MVLPCPLTVIGVVRSARSRTEDTPVQAALNRTELATIEIHEPFAEGLQGLAEFDYAWLLTWLHEPHRSGDGPAQGVPPLTQVPFLLRSERREVGVFAMRGPRRMNSIGHSLVHLRGITGRNVRFAGVDVIDGTPVVDLKPYVTRFDRPDGEPRCGWFDTVPLADGVTPAELGRP